MLTCEGITVFQLHLFFLLYFVYLEHKEKRKKINKAIINQVTIVFDYCGVDVAPY